MNHRCHWLHADAVLVNGIFDRLMEHVVLVLFRLNRVTLSCRRSQSLQSQDSLRKMPRLPSLTPQGVKNLWIRTALFEKVLDKIVLYLVENSRYVAKGQWMSVQLFVLQKIKIPLSRLSSSKYYEKEAVLMDPVDGHILASLLGNYTRCCKHLCLLM